MNITQKKKTVNNQEQNKSQQKISSFFKNLTKTDNKLNVNKEKELLKKRKNNESAESPEQKSKMAKLDTLPTIQSNILNSDNDNISEVSLGIGSTQETVTTEFDSCETDFFFDDDWDNVTPELNLNSLQRCKITAISRDRKCLILDITELNDSSAATVVCMTPWTDLQVEKNDIIIVQAIKSAGKWLVDRDNGLIIVKPDILVSSTTIASSFFCTRKAVLAEIFRRISTLPFEESGDATVMIFGVILHQVLQKCIIQKVNSIANIKNILNETLKSADVVKLLYANDIKLEHCRKETTANVPKIYQFIQHYVKGEKNNEISNNTDNYKGKIHKIHDIEESIWLPQLGLKGNIDISVEISSNDFNRKIVPLEVKTGRPTFSIEHKAQVILYTMMMSLVEGTIDSGLLLYLRENLIKEIKGTHNEKRDLILSRNNLAHYLSGIQQIQFKENNDWGWFKLPEPINHRNACNTCPYKSICCSYLSKEEDNLSSNHPLREISKEVLEDIKKEHIDYIIKWIALLQLETTAQSRDISIKDLWSVSPVVREKKQNCLSNLKVIEKIVEFNDQYRTTFVRREDSGSELLFSVFENLYVALSTDDRVHISAGSVVSTSDKSITVLLDRDITKRYEHSNFHIDKYPFAANVSSFANVVGLLFSERIYSQIREIVIDKKPATFGMLEKSLVQKSVKLLSPLNKLQQKAVLKAVSANEYLLIKGMPGTGKTQTIIALIELLLQAGKSVLVTAHTHNAVDNVLLKLLERNIDFLRLGAVSLVDPRLRAKCEEPLIESCDTPDKLDKVYGTKRLIGVTCYGASHVLLQKRTFDVCIVDESTQVLQPIILRPLYSAQKFILVGDPEQLPPITRSDIARDHGMNESLFSRLDNENNTITLKAQYRMNVKIMSLANKLTYKDQLVAGNDLVERATFVDSSTKVPDTCGAWASLVVSPLLEDSVVLIDTGCTYDLKAEYDSKHKFLTRDRTCSNILEVTLTLYLANICIEMGAKPENIGIIAPYVSHVNLFRKHFPESIEISTVDKYQGRDKDIIFYSCGKSTPGKRDSVYEHDILEDHQRLTVAITRAKTKLVIVSDMGTMSEYSPFKKLFEFVDERCSVKLIDGEDEFSWSDFCSIDR